GTADFSHASGTLSPPGSTPALEAPGYSRMSLRDSAGGGTPCTCMLRLPHPLRFSKGGYRVSSHPECYSFARFPTVAEPPGSISTFFRAWFSPSPLSQLAWRGLMRANPVERLP